MLFDPRDFGISLEDLPEDRVSIDVFIVLGDSCKDPEKEEAGDCNMDAYDEADHGRENLEQDESQVNKAFNDLPDKARSFDRDRSDDDFPLIDTGISAVVEDRDGDDGEACEYIGSYAGSACVTRLAYEMNCMHTERTLYSRRIGFESFRSYERQERDRDRADVSDQFIELIDGLFRYDLGFCERVDNDQGSGNKRKEYGRIRISYRKLPDFPYDRHAV